MAVKWDVPVQRGGDIHNFFPQNIKINPDLNGRAETPDIEEMIESIFHHGQINPVEIRKEAGVPVLVSGFSRYRSIVEINKRNLIPGGLRLKCVYVQCDEKEGFIRNIAENLHRNATTPLDDAHNCRRLQQWGKTIEEIATLIHQKPAWVKSRLALCEASQEVKEALKNKRIKATAAVTLSKASAQAQKDAVSGTNKITTRDIQKAIGKKSRISFKELRDFISSRTGPAEDSSVKTFAEELLKMMDGE